MVRKIISLVIPEEQLGKLDKLRGDVPRSAYVRRLIDLAIEKPKGGKKQ